jgi:WD40 repeat protein
LWPGAPGTLRLAAVDIRRWIDEWTNGLPSWASSPRVRRFMSSGGPLVVAAVAIAAVVLGGDAAGAVTGGANATSSGPPTPAGTGIVARLPLGPAGGFSWSPDGLHLLVSGASGSRVFDRFGKLVSEFAPGEGWLDAGHLIGGDGRVVAISHSQAGTSPPGTSVLANGHGSAAIVGTRPACGDPLVEWYRNGRLEPTQESVTPLGWSPDGEDVVLGHQTCDASGGLAPATAGQGWTGTVRVVDFASGSVLVTFQDVRGELAFSPSGEAIAVQTGSGIEFADVDGGQPLSLPDAQFLGWLDDETMYGQAGGRIELLETDPPDVGAGSYKEWKAMGPSGLQIAGDLTGAALRIFGSDGSTLLDLTTAGLVVERYPTPGEPVVTALQQAWWSPDGRMLALESRDGATLALISVDPNQPGSTASPNAS